MSPEEMSLLLAIIGGCVFGVVVALTLLSINQRSEGDDGPTNPHRECQRVDSICAVSKPAPLASINWDDEEQLRKDGLL